jgi:hypothetical protein
MIPGNLYLSLNLLSKSFQWVHGGMTLFALLWSSVHASKWQIPSALSTHQWCSHLLLLSEYKVVLVTLFPVERLNTWN